MLLGEPLQCGFVTDIVTARSDGGMGEQDMTDVVAGSEPVAEEPVAEETAAEEPAAEEPAAGAGV